MEEFNYFTDDFLSNGGFQQLFSSTEYPDEEIFLWDSTATSINVDYSVNQEFNQFSTIKCTAENVNQFEETNAFANSSPICQYYDFDQPNNQPSPDEASTYFRSEFCEDQWTAKTDDIYRLAEDDWELNLDNLLFDSTPESSFNSNLPDRTLLCNDSCNIFLKESSENLKTFRSEDHVRNSAAAVNQAMVKPIENDARSIAASGENDEEKVFVCTYGDCNKIYAKAGHLKAHLRRHVGDKPYVCLWPNCTWKFSRSDELSRHLRSHSGIKPYKCDYCPKCFSRSDHLTKHRKVHERKMAAMKIKAVWTSLPQGRPGRRPKVLVSQT